MKQNLMKFIMVAFAIAGLGVVAQAADANGDIRSIDAVGSGTIVFPNGGSGHEYKPLDVGESFFVLIRLTNQDYGSKENSHPWMFLPTSPSLDSKYLTSYMYVPKLGLSVGGVRKYAEYSDFGPNGEKSGVNPENPIFTDLYFMYTVESGDIGLPVKLICRDGKVPGESSNTDLELLNVNTASLSLTTNPWKLGNLMSEGGRLVNFHLGPDELSGDPTDPSQPHNPPHRDYTMAGEGVYVQTVDYDPNYADPLATPEKVWREVYPGSAEYVLAAPSLVGFGPATVYVWSSDAAVFDVYGDESKIVTIDGTNYLKIAIGAGTNSVPFRLKGGTADVGATAKIFMGTATAPDCSAVGDIIEDSTLTRTIRMANPPPPNVRVTFDADGIVTTKKVDPVPDCPAEEIADNDLTVPVYITLSETFPSDFHIQLNPSLNDDSACNVFTNKMLGLSASNSSTGYLESYTNVLVKAGAKQLLLYLYPLGADARTLNGITFSPKIVEAAAKEKFAGDITPLILTMRDVRPTVLQPTPSDSLSADKKTGCPIPVEVKDCYRDLNAPQTYSVEYSWVGGGMAGSTNKVNFRAGQATTIVATGFSSKSTGVRIRVQDAQGNWSPWTETVPVLVEATKTVKPELVREQSETAPALEVLKFAEGESINLRFRIEPETAVSMTEMFAFLVPLNEASSNLVETSAFTEGVSFPAEHDVSKVSSTAALRFKDGCAAAEDLRFGVMLRTEDRIDGGTEITDYTPQTMYVSVTNVIPSVLTVERSNEVIPNGGEGRSVAAGVKATFKATLDDVSIIDVTNEQKLVTYWYVKDGDAATDLYVVTSTVNNASAQAVFEHTFEAEGETASVQVAVRDKDMTDKDFTLAPRYSFTLPILAKPFIYFTDAKGGGKEEGEYLYTDENVTKSKGFVNVNLSEATGSSATKTKPVRVKVTWENWGSDGTVSFETNIVHFFGTTKTQKLYFDLAALDGGQDTMFNLTAEVIDDGRSNPQGVKWSDYYVGRDSQLIVNNIDPKLGALYSSTLPLSETGTNTITLNVSHDISWTASDIAPDVTNGFKLTWSGSWGYSKVQTTKDMLFSDDKKTASGTNTDFAVTVEGLQSLTVTLTDKDGGQDQKVFWFYISPTKKVAVVPYGPAASTQSKYDAAQNRGKGRVYTPATRSTQSNFRHTFYFDVMDDQTYLYAFGYPAGADVVDDGKLEPAGYDIALNPNGSTWQSGPYYRPNMAVDSFFYCWMDYSDEPAISEAVNGVPKPAVTPTTLTEVIVTHAKYEGKKDTAYPTKNIEAIFARELLPSDNMGDINGDYIPDLYVRKFKLDGEITTVPTTDLDDKAGLNDDADFLPGLGTSSLSPFIPGLPESWVTEWIPFNAKLELRGYGEGFNDATCEYFTDGVRNTAGMLEGVNPDRIYLDPDTCPTSTLSKVEFLAFIDQGGSTNDVSTWTTWSPERPTDPTKADTDADGFPDGYEYFFWYRAHVGYMENGRHKYLTGRRYDPTHPAETNVITSAEIAALFDPISSSGDASAAETRDSDNDGLPDLLEFKLGTNPVNCDTDGDGLPDGYEVMIGTDPLLWATDKSTCDADLNPDGDWMAMEKVEKQQVFGLDDGNGGVEYYTFGKEGPGDPERAEGIKGQVKYLQWRGEDGKADTNNFWITTEEVKYRTETVDGTNYLYLTKALTSKGTWKGYRTKLETTAAGLPVCGEPVNLPVGWRFDILQETNEEGGKLRAFNVYYGFPASPDDEVRYWKVWHYGRDLTPDKDPKKASNLVFGKEYNHASKQFLGQRALRVQPFEKIVHRLHYHVYQDGGYDPRTAWKGENSVKTMAFTHLDEFYTLAFFYNDGVLPAEELVPTKENPWTVLWEKYSTSPLKADTDEDAMPDGWELYVMGGPKQYVDKEGPEYHERIVEYGPQWKYSPLFKFDLLVGGDRDNDADGLEWPDEYMGVESGAQYPDCATIAAPYETWKARGWHNKKWPTDPWNEDTDGDGLTDGEEEAKVFIYGDPTATGTAGGGLDPLSWDTDHDFLPDPWELEFAGHYVEGASTNMTSVAVSEDKSTTNTVSTTLTAAGDWEGGMNGTVSDAFLDYDYDGLDNWQEYLTGAMRCWRYDDTVSPWTNLANPSDYIPDPSDEEAWNEFWYGTLIDEQSDLYNPHFAGGTYDNGASWFSMCTNAWDSANGFFYMFKDGVYHDLRLPPDRYIIGSGDEKMIFNRFTYRVYQMFLQTGQAWSFWINGIDPPGDYRVYPEKYVCCDPTMHDTDLDGMDDYYELFHGMNPLLGLDQGDTGAPRPPQDVVYRAYGGDMASAEHPDGKPCWSAQNNYWMQYGAFDFVHPLPHPKPRTKHGNGMDFEIYPWLNGLAHADPDGDNIPNQQEAILANVQAAASYLHTDPTPLWMTDTDYGDSLTRRYFRDPLRMKTMVSPYPDGFKHVDPETGKTNEYKFADFPLFSYDEKTLTITIDLYSLSVDMWDATDYFWSFEENEGYDSDHDYLSDFEEGQGKTKPASDPQNSDDPLRRQAMYFGGEGNPGLLQTPLAHTEQVPYADVASEARQNFLYYTAECWVKAEDVDPDKGLQTILERTIQCSSENPADENLTRRNFLLGVKNGRWYTKFDSTGTDANQPVEITDGPQATTNWTHLAATYDGTALRLYVDGVCNNRNDTSIQPEHGISAAVVNDYAELITSVGQRSVTYDNLGYPLISILVGASAVGQRGVVMDYNPRVDPFAAPTTVADYTGFFKGYVDEVRIWDGARPASDILSDFQKKTRYNAALAAENRQVVYSNWRTGARRTPVSAAQLPAQLMYHFTFDHLPGAVRAADVLRSPAGFVTATTVTDAKAIWSRPEGWVQSWWYGTLANLRSKVYAKERKDCAWVPWIANTVAHLPRFDGTTLDSVYWSETYAGAVTAAAAGYPRFAFPRNHEVASKWRQMTYNTASAPWSMHSHADFLETIDGENGELTSAYRFAMRDRKTEGDDLLPLLGAFPKRISAAEGGMWDDQGAADAWAQTGQDSNNDSLPDWWQAYARANYCKDIDPRQALTWDTTVTYHGVMMPAWQAYLRDLAAGMLPGGKTDENYADTRDFDADGMPDWWEEQNKVQGYSQADADADPDNDGLSNYAEYLLGEVYPFAYGLPALDPEGYKQPKLDPQHAYSSVGQRVVDYFQSFSTNHIKVTTGAKTHFWLDEYFGEIATDHDFMEDWWENAFKSSYVSSKVYDPLDDTDEDGWSNWAECRASLWGGYFNAALIDSWTGSDSDQYVANYPVPVIGVKATYHGLQDVSGHQLVIRTTTGQTPRVDATFIIPPDLDAQTRYIGPFLGDYMMRGHLSPGQVNANSVVFSRAKNDMNKTFYWNWNWYEGQNIKHPDVRSGSFDEYRSWYMRYPHIELEGGDLVWEAFAIAVETLPGVADIMFVDGNKIGKLNSVTGEYEFDLTKTGSDFGIYAFSVKYTSRIGHEWPQTVYVSDTKELVLDRDEKLCGNGHVREGRNTIEVFLDLNGDGLYTAGEPFGSARNVQVGWHKVPELTIELKDDSPIMPVVVVADAPKKSGGGETSITIAENEDGSITMTEKTTAAEETVAALTKTIKVIREAINGYAAERTLMTKTVVVDDHPYVSEVDVSTAAKPDLDWTWLQKDAAKIAAKHEEFAAIESAVYRVDEVVTVDGVTTTNTLKRFRKEFPATRPTAAALSPVGSAAVPAPVYSASPTFSFSVNDTKATGYRLQIRKVGAASPVYDSGISLLPGRGGSTVGVAACAVTPPVYVGAPVYSGTTTNREVFADGTNYQWRVALYDAKYNSTADDSDLSSEWSAWANFEMDLANESRYPRFATGYGVATAAVRYYGPATNDLRGKIVVEAFENADFRGQPLAQVRVGDLGELRSLNEPGAGNAVLRGIRPGTVFLRAFIDQNDNGSRDKWESWGYANMVGQGFKAINNPDPLEVTVSTADWIVGGKADRVIYIEDCDANKNEQPDCLEPELFPEDVSSDVEETEPIDWWEWAEADPDDVTEGDVMAYREVMMKLVTLWDGADANVLKSYLLCDGQPTPVAGNVASNYAFMTAWEYGTLTACGVPVPAADLKGLKVYETPKDVKVALIHAQVREKYGFCADTAIPGGQTDTKPFTAQDKYFVLRYLEQTGRLAEPVPEGYKSFEDYVMNSGNVKLYEKYCLKPNVIDNDHDGIADGFELYIDSKPLDASDRESDWDDDGVPLWREFELDPDTGLAHATDPRKIDTDGDGITDKDFHDYLLWDAGGDFDGDGLSNYAEYLITRVFKAAQLDPRNPKTDGACVDYFRKMGDLYFGEIFTDHDQVNDVWEGDYPNVANRYVYDPSRDDDGDGWSNYAEFRAGTDPSRVANLSIENSEIAEYPQPMIVARITGAEDCTGKVIVKAYPPDMVGRASATWEMSTGNDKSTNSTNANSKVLGSWRRGTKQSTLSPSSIQPGSVLISAKDLGFKYFDTEWNDDYYAYYGLTAASDTRWSQGAASDAQWVEVIHDVMREDDNLMGDLVYTGGTEKKTVGWINYETGLMEIDFSTVVDKVLRTEKILQTSASSTQAGNTTSTILAADSYYHNTLTDMCNSYFKVNYVSQFVSQGSDQKFYLTEAKSGHVREGLNTFIAFVDEDGDGEFTPGEPFGVAQDVDVGWQGASFLIGLTDTSAITPRIDLWDDTSDRVSTVNEALQASAVSDPLLKVWLTNEEMRVWYAGVLSNRVALVNPPDAGERTHVRVVRYGIDDMFCYRVGVYGALYQQRAVIDKFFDPKARDFLCEADFLCDGQFDIDWDYLQSEVLSASGASQLAVSNMTYLVVIGDGPTSFRGSKDTNTTVNALSTMVTRRFEVTRHLPVAENVEGVVYGARPTFRWSIPDEEPWAKAYGTSYTAFKLQILREDGKTVVYDSDVRRLPPQAKDGSFTWTADAFVGDKIAAAGQWKWRVAMYNAKFKPLANRDEKWSNVVSFSTAAGTQQETDDHNYSSVDVSVKYTGPALVLSDAGFVRVQAFETADFSGTPAAQISITGINSVKDATDIRKNGTLIGLKFGTYYIRAYIDTNKNGVKDAWESWGAAKDAVIVKPNQLAPIVGLYIEDADTDQDWLPDAWEVAKYGNLATKGANIDPQGKIVLKREIYEALQTGTANISRFLSGASLTFFQNIGNVSLALGLDDVTEASIAEIRAMVEKNIDPNTVKITSLVVDPGNGTDGKVILTVAAKATDSIAGYLLSPVYELPKSTDVTINIYRKDNLATDQWTFVKAVPKTITTTLEERVEVPIEGVDFNSGFYKVEIVQ